MNLYIDSHEPDLAIPLMGTTVPTERTSLNEHGWADYKWDNYNNSPIHVERKTWSELLGAIDKVEDQLRRHMTNQPKAKLIFLLEGISWPDPGGTMILRKTDKNSNLWVNHRTSPMRLPQVYSWIYQISKYIEVIQTSSYPATCMALVSMYKGDQKPEESHTTFSRYYKEATFNPNPQVAMLMGMSTGIGETRAKALIKEFHTIWNVFSATPTELSAVNGIGTKTATQILQRIGRVDV